MTWGEYSILAFSSLFVIVDSIGTVPAFLAMTQHNTPEERSRMARLACLLATGVLVFFALTGMWIFRIMGITLPAFQMAGSLVLFMIAYDMLRARRSAVKETAAETEEGMSKEDIAITPLGIPMLAGPGAITTTILLQSKAQNLMQILTLYACILAVGLISYGILHVAARGARLMTPTAMKITTRLMGLLLASVAAQFLLNALKEIKSM
ncbi:MAG TPA: antibiotic resistance protein MarC [Verrucomicrobia bacterium]|nr:MAG: antibiotic resistance protein MarC [Lentisphaerae bacterium GWF2_57_35]HBA83583.1 antibiotic resistance protein MarC [Verrucomicrobiota bacterium]